MSELFIKKKMKIEWLIQNMFTVLNTWMVLSKCYSHEFWTARNSLKKVPLFYLPKPQMTLKISDLAPIVLLTLPFKTLFFPWKK